MFQKKINYSAKNAVHYLVFYVYIGFVMKRLSTSLTICFPIKGKKKKLCKIHATYEPRFITISCYGYKQGEKIFVRINKSGFFFFFPAWKTVYIYFPEVPRVNFHRTCNYKTSVRFTFIVHTGILKYYRRFGR